jgi:uncharacterized membrane protein YedE/YeeE
MTYWSWWAGGLALAGVMLFHWLATARMMAVSGRYTALVNRVRFGPQQVSDGDDVDTAALIAAMRAATLEQFGEGAVAEEPPTASAPDPIAAPAPKQDLSDHLVFLACLAIGGLASALTSARFHVTALLAGDGFARLSRGSGVLGVAILVVGGMCVGFGTRMAGGCTSGHGMCGVSRLQKGSLLATAGFFGTGVVTALALGWLR